MAEPAPPTMDSAIASTVEQLKKVLLLPSGWRATFSLRMTADTASILVSWSPAVPSGAEKQAPGRTKKKKKRSKSSQKRSAERGQRHRDRIDQQSVQPRQQARLDPFSPPFIPHSASGPGNPVVGSARDRMGVDRPDAESINLDRSPQVITAMLSPPPPPALHPGVQGGVEAGGSSLGFKRGRGEELKFDTIADASLALFERWECGDQMGQDAVGEVVDRLAGQRGFAQILLEWYTQRKVGPRACAR
jgi:hypothetical protein